MNQGTDQPLLDTAPLNSTEWASWFSRQEATVRQVYLTMPKRLIADYYGEQGLSRDYEGREILELLQNASDAAAEIDHPGRVMIKLVPQGLVVANTGAPFTRGGVESLQTSNLSPKRRSRRPLIGCKGLGFRAVLNWSRFPIILSGGLALAYTEQYARAKLDDLTRTDPALAALVRDETQGGTGLIMPLLAFPAFRPDGELRPLIDLEAARTVLTCCEQLRAAGFDTAIGMPFDRPQAYEHAVSQITSLCPELLLFVRYLSEITICLGDTPPQVWRRDQDSNHMRVIVDGTVHQEWDVYTQTDSVPTERLEEGLSSLAYEIVVAVPRTKPDKPLPLFSFFPTDIPLPLLVTCHATLDLQQNRQHARETAANRFVLSEMASFLARVAETHGLAQPDKPWAACDLLVANGDFGPDLERADFSKKLFAAARTKAIIPTLSGKRSAAPAARVPVLSGRSWLPVEEFGDVVQEADFGRQKVLNSLEVPELTDNEMIERLRRLTRLTLNVRVNLIVGLIQNPTKQRLMLSSLLLDSDGQPVPEGARTFVAPSGGQSVPLPPWVKIRFLNEDLRKALAAKLPLTDARMFQVFLSGFHVVEYSLDNLVTSLVAAANRRAKAESENAARYDLELLQAVFKLFPASVSESQRSKFPEQSNVRLPTQAGGYADARTLYLGAGYPPFGTVTQELFGRCSPAKLVAPLAALELHAEADTVAAFLRWLGVEPWPRHAIADTPHPDYLHHILRSLKYPAQFQDYHYAEPDRIPGPMLGHVKSIEGLEAILHTADPNAIIAWLALDWRANEWQHDKGDNAVLSCDPSRTQYRRAYSGALPSYIRWVIQLTPWLPLSTGEKGKPMDCIIADRAIEALFPRPRSLAPDVMAKYGVSAAMVREGWTRSGVMPGLSYLDREQLYRLLLELPDRNPDGQSARALYRWLLDAEDSAMGESGPYQAEFHRTGRMWGRHSAQSGYFPIRELRHADSEDLPKTLLDKLKIVDLPKRVGAEKVERVFRVRPVERANIGKKVKQHVLALGHSKVAAEFQESKPYLFALRQSQTTQAQNLNRLRQLKLWVCSNVQASVEYEGETTDYELDVWEWLLTDEDLFVRVDPAEIASLSSDLLADSIGAAVAALFRLGDGGDFARLLHCQNKDRDCLLRRMRGESPEEDLVALKQRFEVNPEDRVEELQVMAVTAASGTSVQAPAAVTPEAATTATAVSSASATATTASPTVMHVVEQERQVAPPPTRTALRVHKPSQPGFRVSGTAREVVDGQFCEKKAMEFELSDEPARFPLLVSSVQGFNAPGCDILSFDTAGDRDAFLTSETKDGRLVKRFIEVKGRSSDRAKIALKGNELSAAERFRDRYFLYRLFEEDAATLILAVLKHPLGATEAIEQSVDVSLERAKDTREFRLLGGLTREAAMEWDGKELPATTATHETAHNA